MGFGISIGGSKSKTKDKPYKRTGEMKALFKSFMDDFFGGTGAGLSYEQALEQAATKTGQRYETEVAAPRKEYFGENRGLLSKLISETQAARQPIDIKFGGENLLKFLPYTNKLSNLATQRSGLESDYLTGTGQDISLLHQLALEPKTKLMDFYTNFLLPLEQARFKTTGQSKTTGSKWGTEGGISDQEGAVIAKSLMAGSSKILKKDIHRLSDSLNKVCQLEGKAFKWKHDDSIDAGVIAEEVENIIPEAVHEVNGIKHISITALIGYLIEAIKELKKDKLQGEVI